MPEKRRSGLSSFARAWGPPTPRGVAGLRCVFRVITTACSERPPLVRHARGGTLAQGVLRGGSTCWIAAACASGMQAAGGNRAEREFRGEFLPVRSSGREPSRTFHAAWHMWLRVSSYSLRERQGNDAETDFRRAAPAAASRQVESASDTEAVDPIGRDTRAIIRGVTGRAATGTHR